MPPYDNYAMFQQSYNSYIWNSSSATTNTTLWTPEPTAAPKPKKKATAVDWLRERVSEITDLAFTEVLA